MKVLFLSPPSDFARQVAAALVDEGHMVDLVNDRVDYTLPSFLQRSRRLWRLIRRVPFLRRRSNDALQKEVLARAAHADLLLATKGMNLSRETLNVLDRMGVVTAVWFPDNAANEPYASWVRSEGPHWRYFFSFDSAIYNQMPTDNQVRVHVLPFGVDPESFDVTITEDDREQFSCQVGFVGAPYPDRIRLLESVADLDLKIWGWKGWEYTSLARFYQGPLDSQGSAKAYRLSKICVNTNILPHARGVNLKTFEICAAEGFQLTDGCADLKESFVVGTELDTFIDPAGFRQKVLFWLEHASERQHIAWAGRERVVRDHTLRHRVRAMLAKIALQ